jgi:protein PhnA
MSLEQTLMQRCDNKCELCTTSDNLSVYEVPPVSDPDSDKSVMLCATCKGQIEQPDTIEENHWRCLNDSMWSQTPAVQVMAWRMLNRLKVQGWAHDLLDMMYMEDDVINWAKSGATDEDSNSPTRDSNGAVLQAGDSVTLIKDLVVKGANFTAKRGTAVRNISLTDNPEHIEGRVNGTRIVLLTCYLKKSG